MNIIISISEMLSHIQYAQVNVFELTLVSSYLQRKTISL